MFAAYLFLGSVSTQDQALTKHQTCRHRASGKRHEHGVTGDGSRATTPSYVRADGVRLQEMRAGVGRSSAPPLGRCDSETPMLSLCSDERSSLGCDATPRAQDKA